MAREGWGIAISDINQESAQAVAAEIEANGGRARGDALDVTDADAVSRWVDEVDQDLGGLTGAVANAGIITVGPLLDATPEDWRRVMAVNLDGTFFFTQAAARRMVERRHGSIVIMASAGSRRASEGLGPYCTSKTGLHGLTRNLALELSTAKVRVNAISPGIVDTDMWAQIDRGKAAMQGRRPGEPFADMLKLVPLGRAQEPEDVATMTAFLLSDKADYITGQNISYDGGFQMP
jgi:NAD(P)-dependent dehydrogenase (short-subunit alcohol dehydrogenase family)